MVVGVVKYSGTICYLLLPLPGLRNSFQSLPSLGKHSFLSSQEGLLPRALGLGRRSCRRWKKGESRGGLCLPSEKQSWQPFPFGCFRGSRMKEGMSNNSTTSISQARKAVEQLKMEACMDRVKVSQAAADLLAYCEAHVREDPLVTPVPASENPFREKKFFCTIL
nr:heterotrimeric guanine nucleotide-binding protein 3C [Equus caballus]